MSTRAAALFCGITLAALTLICGLFLAADVPIPGWFTLAGRWLPALASLVVLRLMKLPGGLATWWNLHAGGWNKALGGSAVAIIALIACYALSVTVLAVTGQVTAQPLSALGQVAILLVPMILLFSLSTFGEEVGWRGFLQQALADKGFWSASSIVAAVWVLFHIPLHGAMALQGLLPWPVAILTTLGLFPLGLFLSAAVVRWGSVWPAVFAHAVPFSALNLITNVDELSVTVHVLLAVVTAVVLLGAAAVISRAPSAGRPTTPHAPAPAAG